MFVSPVPEGYHTITPYLLVADARGQLEFLRKVFDARVRMVMPPGADQPDATGPIMHAELEMGTSRVMLAQARGAWGPMASGNHVYLPDVDAAYARALAAGAESIYAPRDEFYGDRAAGVKDPHGNTWWLATHKEDLTAEQIMQRAAAAQQQ